MSDEPILVLTMGRSGSSMVAGILAQHGVWTGNCMRGDHRNPKGYFENLQMKRELVRMAGKKVTTVYGPDPAWRPFIEGVKDQEGYDGGPWLFKHNVIYWKLWLDYPRAKCIFPWREPSAIFRSVRKSKFHSWQSDDQLRETILLHHAEMERVAMHFGGIYVDTEQVVRGDRSSLREAVEHAGLEYDDEKALEFINPDYWHERTQ